MSKTFDLDRVVESKRAARHELAQRPVAEKLRILDALADREATIRAATKITKSRPRDK